MRALLAVAAVGVGLAGCGNAESIDPAEIDAENVRREEARAVEAATAAKERANEEIDISGPGDLDIGSDPAPKGEQGAVTREEGTPPKRQ